MARTLCRKFMPCWRKWRPSPDAYVVAHGKAGDPVANHRSHLLGRGQERDAAAVERLLRRLTRHGDRIFVSIGERLREIVDVDWSAFQLAVAPSSR